MQHMEESMILIAFKWISRLEGASLLLLLLVAMPLKYFYGWPELTKILGAFHGMFFLLYIALVKKTSREVSWSGRTRLLAYFAALIPWGTFYFESRFLTSKITVREGAFSKSNMISES